jgi:hypothetical protein
MPYLPADLPPVVIVADARGYADPNSRPDPYPSITKYTRIEQARTQQRLNELAPKAMADPEAARQYRQLSDWNARQVQILTDPTR